MRTDADSVPVHRKIWEFARVTRALQESGVWHDQSLGLSVAGGRERFLFFAANHIRRMVSTDIYGLGDFARREADEAFIERPGDFAPFPFRESHLSIGRMNGLSQTFPDDLFDFTVSFSSIEHFGGLSRAAAAIREMARVTRPGGIIAVTTDCSLNGFTTNEIFTQRQIQWLAEQSGCRVREPFDFRVSAASKVHILDMLRDDLGRLPHVNLKIRAAIFTSVCMVLQKPSAGRAAASTVEARLAAIDSAVTQSLAQSPAVLIPAPSFPRRVLQRAARALRGARYRLEERLYDYRRF